MNEAQIPDKVPDKAFVFREGFVLHAQASGAQPILLIVRMADSAAHYTWRKQANSYVIPKVRLNEEVDAGLKILRQNGVSWSVAVVSS